MKKGEKMKKAIIFLAGVRSEVDKIRWSTGKELLKNSVATLSVIIIVGAFFVLTDSVFAGLKMVIG